MVNIITKKNIGKLKVLRDFEAFFNFYVNIDDFEDLDWKVIQELDHAIYVSGDVIKTPYGETTYGNLSTGCKTVLSYLYLKRNPGIVSEDVVLDLVECGSNALSILFDCVSYLNDDSTLFLISHKEGIVEVETSPVRVNGVVSNSLWEGLADND